MDTLIDFNSAVIPAAKVTNNMLAILEPITFPTEISGEFLITASIDTKSSQSEVPNPTTINPMKNSETFSFFPIAIELEIKMSAPLTRRNRPKVSNIMLMSIN